MERKIFKRDWVETTLEKLEDGDEFRFEGSNQVFIAKGEAYVDEEGETVIDVDEGMEAKDD